MERYRHRQSADVAPLRVGQHDHTAAGLLGRHQLDGAQHELAQLGAFIEHCFTTMYTGKASWDGVLAAIRKAGPERCVLSTDLGQTINPPVAEGFAMFAQRLLDGGFTVDQIRRMAVTNPSALIQ